MYYIPSSDTLYLCRTDVEPHGLLEAFKNWTLGRYAVVMIEFSGEKYAEYGSIPTRSRNKLPSKREWIRRWECEMAQKASESSNVSILQRLTTAVTIDYQKFVSCYYEETGNEAKSVALAKAAAVLEAGASMKFGKSTGTIQEYMHAVNSLQLSELRFGKPLQTREGVEWVNMNEQVAYRKLREFKANPPTKVVALKRAGNSNARKITQEVNRVVTYIYACLGSGNLLPSQIYSRYESWRRNGGAIDYDSGEYIELPELSESSLTAIVRQPEVQAAVTLIKHGQKAFNNYFMPYVVGKRPEYMLSTLGMDDEDTPFYLKINVKGKIEHTYSRAKVVFVFDAATRKIVGYAMGTKGTLDLYREAVCSYLRGEFCPETRGVVAGEVQLDHYTKGNKEEWEKAFKRINFGRAKNPQERYAEREIQAFEYGYLRTCEGWLGGNITSKRYQNKRNEDNGFVRYELHELDEMYRAFIPIFNAENGTEKAVNPSLTVLPEHLLALYAGEGRELTIKRGLLEISFGGIRHKYEVGTEEMPYESVLSRLAHGFRVRVWYLPCYDVEGKEIAPKEVYLFNWTDKDDKYQDEFLVSATLSTGVQRSWEEMTETDSVELNRQRYRKDKFRLQAESFAAEIKGQTLMPYAEAEGIMAGGYNGNKEELQRAEARLNMGEGDEKEEEKAEEWSPYAMVNPRYKQKSKAS